MSKFKLDFDISSHNRAAPRKTWKSRKPAKERSANSASNADQKVADDTLDDTLGDTDGDTDSEAGVEPAYEAGHQRTSVLDRICAKYLS